MATDDSPPRNKLIITYAIVCVVLLIGLKFGLDWYYLDMTEGERARTVSVIDKYASPIGQQRAVEVTKLDDAPTSLEAAMHALEQRGRTATDDVSPTPSSDQGAVAGWNGFDLIDGTHAAAAGTPAAPNAPAPEAVPNAPAPPPPPSAPAPGTEPVPSVPNAPAPPTEAANAPANAPPPAVVPTTRVVVPARVPRPRAPVAPAPEATQ